MGRAKGLSESAVMFGYAARNAMLPVLTNLALMLGAVFGGSIVTEIVFNYPGLGLTLYTASVARDYPVIQGQLLLMTMATLGANLLVDIHLRRRRSAHPGGAAHDLGVLHCYGGRRRPLPVSPSFVALCLMALLAPLIAPGDPGERVGRSHQPPTVEHVFGTTKMGRDVYSQFVWGAQSVACRRFCDRPCDHCTRHDRRAGGRLFRRAHRCHARSRDQRRAGHSQHSAADPARVLRRHGRAAGDHGDHRAHLLALGRAHDPLADFGAAATANSSWPPAWSASRTGG